MRLLSDRAMPTIFFCTGEATGRGSGRGKEEDVGKSRMEGQHLSEVERGTQITSIILFSIW